MRIAIDAMGGDFAPAEVVKGAARAAKELNVKIALVGDEVRIKQELGKVPTGVEVVHASQVIEMHEHPAAAVRRKREASVVIAAELVADGKADAMISAGNSGAAMAVAMMKIGRIQGIERPGIATLVPSTGGRTILLDVGANMDCTPQNLLDYAVMGSVYAEQVMGINEPRVGLLNIGEEATKGNELTKAAYLLLQEAPLNFIGNIEGRHLFTDEADVVVCDGFIGNVTIKVGEGIGEFVLDTVKREVNTSAFYRLAALALMPCLKRLKKKVDYAEYGGAPLLGVNGICIISHGRSDERAIFNAVRAAARAVDSDVVGRIRSALEKTTPSPVPEVSNEELLPPEDLSNTG